MTSSGAFAGHDREVLVRFYLQPRSAALSERRVLAPLRRDRQCHRRVRSHHFNRCGARRVARRQRRQRGKLNQVALYTGDRVLEPQMYRSSTQPGRHHALFPRRPAGRCGATAPGHSRCGAARQRHCTESARALDPRSRLQQRLLDVADARRPAATMLRHGLMENMHCFDPAEGLTGQMIQQHLPQHAESQRRRFCRLPLQK